MQYSSIVLPIALVSVMTWSCSSSTSPSPSVGADAAPEAPTDAGARDSSVAVVDATADASTGSGGACLDGKSSGDGMPYTCDVFSNSTSEADKTTACGAFTRVDSCPTAGVTYRCGNAKSLVAPTVRTERSYYLVQSPAADKATSEDCTSREGSYSKL